MYRYTAIGDSLTVGTGAPPGKGFAPLYLRSIERYSGSRVLYRNLGVKGMTCPELLRNMTSSLVYRNALAQADMITISIGGNDLIRIAQSTGGKNIGPGMLQLQQCLCQTLAVLYSIKASSRAPFLIRFVGLYNPFPEVAEAAVGIRSFNAFLSSMNAPYFRVAHTYSSFKGRERQLLSSDRVHPNGRGYRVIAAQLDKLGFYPLF
ncbi:GDSL-type esterase/lipase family protein [Paenibacillus sp. P96]|uniref:GDSL-type esterase/lipase family protein n=1 Tax=Paenibacillus zeirhizosphaerae TaxID=2987519 RepID=A0ABT9FS92_9BACL|nr:GDSL-type esterase/lipase family protein [Paenibacillus sp. P96]MDP4097598.1 GDSL-type esterase/lipase family protein [Paenibacillus sp. P96]